MTVESDRENEADACRYRFLKTKFKLRSERSERDIYVDSKGGFKRYITEVSYWHCYQLEEDWRLGEHSKNDATSLNKLIDDWMEEEK